MAENDDTQTHELTDVERAEQAAREAQVAAEEARKKAEESGKQADAKKADEAAEHAENKAAEAQAVRQGADRDASTGTTVAEEVKSVSAAVDRDTDIGDHKVQTFANTPENPPPAPGLKPVDDDNKVRLEITDSDHPDPANPKVTYVHPEQVGDYLRAGWRNPGA